MKYEIHAHTYYSSCSNLSPSRLVEECRKKGLNGVCVVDHDSFKGAVEAEKYVQDMAYKDFKVIKGIEFSTKIGHILGIFLSKEIKYDKNKDSIKWLIKEIHKQKGIVIYAHPCTITRGINILKERLNEYDFDYIEAYNARNIFRFENTNALKLAEKLKKPIICGSDAHFVFEIGKNYIMCDNIYNCLKKNRFKMHYINPYLNFIRISTKPYTKYRKFMQKIGLIKKK